MVLAEVQSGVLVRSFVIALVVVAPFAWWQWRRLRSARDAAAARAAAEAPAPPPPELPALEELVGSIGALARGMEPGRTCTLEVPDRLTIGGHEADAALVDALVRDALRRDGLVVTHEVVHGTGRALHCTRG